MWRTMHDMASPHCGPSSYRAAEGPGSLRDTPFEENDIAGGAPFGRR